MAASLVVDKFQPTPRFVSEGNCSGLTASAPGLVSTHPPLRQRGERSTLVLEDIEGRFQPTPRFVSEGNASTQVYRRLLSFNPPPASSARERGRGRDRLPCSFQPTPRFVSEGNARSCDGGRRCRFNPPPASSARGTPEPLLTRPSLHVSTHPPLRQRGERLPLRPRACGGCGVSTHPPLRQRGEPPAHKSNRSRA